MGAIAVIAFMPGTGVVHIDFAGHLKADGLNTFFLLVKTILFFNQMIVVLPGGCVNV